MPTREARGEPSSLPRRVWAFAEQLDVVGLFLIGTSISLILLPLTLAPRAHGQWHNRESSSSLPSLGCRARC